MWLKSYTHHYHLWWNGRNRKVSLDVYHRVQVWKIIMALGDFFIYLTWRTRGTPTTFEAVVTQIVEWPGGWEDVGASLRVVQEHVLVGHDGNIWTCWCVRGTDRT